MTAARRNALSIKSLFLLTILLKIGASVAGWWLGSPWLLGFAVPLALMLIYILLGIYRGDDTISDEKFADSCYYLGFIFTLSSILIALLDIPSIATKLGDISVRFGAAMVSTVLGLIVRVYLVNFRPDFQDAVHQAEDGLMDSVRSFRVHLDLAVGRLREFQTLVHEASRQSVTQADLALQDAAADHARHFGELLEKLAAEHRKLIEESAEHMKATTQTLSNALHDYAQALVSGTGKFEAGALEFSGKLDARLDRMVLPEDYFANRLDPAVSRLGQSAAAAGEQMAAMAAEFRDQTRKIAAALDGLARETSATGTSIEQVRAAVLDRAEALDLARQQIAVFKRFGETVEKMESNVNRSLASIGALEQGVRRMVEEAGKVAGAHREMGLMAPRPAELTAGIERGDEGLAAAVRRIGSESRKG